jgi:hypothetical protein
MKLNKHIFVLFILLLSCIVKPQVVKDTASVAFPYSIYSIDSRLVDEYYSFDSRTHYTHDVIPFIERGYNYEIELKLKLEGNYTVPDSSIGVIIKTWKGEEEMYILNPKNAVLKYNNYYTFSFAFVSDNRSYATCSLVTYDKTNNTFSHAVYSNIKMSRSVLLH